MTNHTNDQSTIIGDNTTGEVGTLDTVDLSVSIDAPANPQEQTVTIEGGALCIITEDLPDPGPGDPPEPLSVPVPPGEPFPRPEKITKVEVSVNGGVFQLATKVGTFWTDWRFTHNAGSANSVQLRARATAVHAGTHHALSNQVTVLIDRAGPELTIDSIPDVTSTEPPYTTTIRGTVSDAPAGVDRVEYRIGSSGSFKSAFRSGTNWSKSNVELPGLGNHTLTVRAFDNLDHETTEDRTIVVRDATAPNVTITSPPEDAVVTWDEDAGQVVVTFTGTATDTQTGVDRVEWALNGQNDFTLATPTGVNGSWNTWSAGVVIPAAQQHTVIIRARDGAGNQTSIQRRVTVIMPFEPPDPLDVVSLPSYLHDLLKFTRIRIHEPDPTQGNAGQPVDNVDLAAAFHQPFAELAELPHRSVAHQRVHQNRICIEVLRGYLARYGITIPPVVESTYTQEVYPVLLRNLGTSYDELRLVRVADGATRSALAQRLGFRLSGTRPDMLDTLTLPLDQVSQADLERLFGLIDSRRDPLTTVDVPPAELLVKQLAHLRARWRDQDNEQRSPLGTFVPIIDPDVIRISDLKEEIATDGNPVHDRLVERQVWVAEQLSDLAALRDAESTEQDGFNAMIVRVFGSTDVLEGLFANYQDGADITPQLTAIQLEMPPFLYLMQFGNLVVDPNDSDDDPNVFDDEWESVFSILTQVQKLRQAATWRTEERESNLTLSPDYFVLPAATTPTPDLPAWRATEQARQVWLDTLQVRIDQDQVVRQSLQIVIDEAENVALPLLRDALIAIIEPNSDHDRVANRLTQEVMIDMQSNDTQRIKRVDQAIQTLQGALFGLRIGHFDALEPLHEPLTPANWELTTVEYDETKFDEEWQWMGAYATWRSAMFVFGYPDTYLLPTLRPAEQQTGAFAAFVEEVRTETRLTPHDTRIKAGNYLKELRDEFGSSLPLALRSSSFVITDQLSDSDLTARRGMVEDLFENITEPHQIPNYLSEVFYFVPVLLATQLQQSGQYLAALDWFQSVYAFNFPVGERKIYHGLTLEATITSAFGLTDDWLLEGLNAHDIVTEPATRRQYAYTRYLLMALSRCFLEFADSEFTRDTNESLPRARTLYVTLLQLLNLPEMQHDEDQFFPPNPVIQSLQTHAELNLHKLRSGRNIAGLERQVELDILVDGLPIPSQDGTLTLARPATLRPTPYRYAALIERAQQLVSMAQQVEAAFLAALEKRDLAAYDKLRAQQDVELAEASVRLQDLRVIEANRGIELARLQRNRSRFQANHFNNLLNEGVSLLEQRSLAALGTSLRVADSVGVSVGITGPSLSVSFSPSGKLQTMANILSTTASYERRKQDWAFQRNLARRDELIGEQHIAIARDQVAVVGQEQSIARTRVQHTNETIAFLENKFTNEELYEWMSGVLGQVYSYFLQQATAVAHLAQNQLAFERQETPPSFIQSDYWQVAQQSTTDAPDRQGLTGSVRLLQDITRLDQHAFETNRRKLELSHTISLAQLAPAEFQHFREAGRMVFATPMELFEQAFPGHYLRLIKRVRTSVIALISPFQDIRATLTSTGLSRVVVGDNLFQTTVIRRDPEQVALTSPSNATGLFELRPESELLLPFEGTGVDTVWEFQMPRAANAFDFNTIADVLITIDYTAFASPIYREQVIKQLDRTIQAERAFSFRQQFADQWYDLHNPDQTTTPLRVQFETRRADFPPNLENLRIKDLLISIARTDGITAELLIDFHFIEPDGDRVGGSALTIDGIVSTRRNGSDWRDITGSDITGLREPFGLWELALPDTPEVRSLFANEAINDILFVISFRAQTPEWPVT